MVEKNTLFGDPSQRSRPPKMSHRPRSNRNHALNFSGYVDRRRRCFTTVLLLKLSASASKNSRKNWTVKLFRSTSVVCPLRVQYVTDQSPGLLVYGQSGLSSTTSICCGLVGRQVVQKVAYNIILC